MKYILIALLFCVGCWGTGGKAQRTHGDSIFIYGDTIIIAPPMDSGWIDNTNSVGIAYGVTDGTYRIKKDTVKPLNIKMKSRWRDSLTSIKDGAIRDMTDFELGSTLTIDSGWLSKGGYDTIRNFGEEISRFIISLNTDTVKVIMLCSDTSSQNGYRTQRCYWMYGYAVGEVITTQSISNFDRYGIIKSPEVVYLDDKKVPLSKNLVVWMSKELK